MPTILDIFNQDAFSASALTGNVTLVPNSYGRINELGLFTPEPIATTSVTLFIENGVLTLLPTRPRGGPASLGTRGKQKPKAFYVPHIPLPHGGDRPVQRHAVRPRGGDAGQRCQPDGRPEPHRLNHDRADPRLPGRPVRHDLRIRADVRERRLMRALHLALCAALLTGPATARVPGTAGPPGLHGERGEATHRIRASPR